MIIFLYQSFPRLLHAQPGFLFLYVELHSLKKRLRFKK